MFRINKKIFKKVLVIFAVCTGVFLLTAAVVAGCYFTVESYGKYVLPLEALPQCHTAVVMGCSPTVRNGRFRNSYFVSRMKGAAELYHSGKVKTLLLSGDNHIKEYNEPHEMRKALVALKVPDEAIYCDYAGFRTLDSVLRAQMVFGQRKFIVLSQTFHCQRAIYLARHSGIECYGCAADVRLDMRWTLRRYLRETAARVVAVCDVLFDRQPKFYGAQVDMHIPQKKDPESI